MEEAPRRGSSAEERSRLDQADQRFNRGPPGNADVGDLARSPAWALARVDPQPRLGGVEGDRRRAPCTAAAATSPVEASTPLGHVDAHAPARRGCVERVDRARHRLRGARPESRCPAARLRPAPARRTAAARRRAGARRRPSRRAARVRPTAPRRGPAAPGREGARGWRGASPVSSSGAATQTTSTSRPPSRSILATTSPSPPLLPLPQRTVDGPVRAPSARRRG